MLAAMDGFARHSIEDAAHRLGLSVSTLRRRIRAGSLAVEREETPQGYRYVVLVPEDAAGGEAQLDGSEPVDGDRLRDLIAERDWLRRRVEELTTLLNREQEAVLRLSTEREAQPLPPAQEAIEPPSLAATLIEPIEPQRSPDSAVAQAAAADPFVLAARVREQLKEAGVRKKVRRRLVQRLLHIVGG